MLPKKDLLILISLRQNARETLTQISKKTSIPISTIYDKLKYYHGSIITKHATLLDFSKLGFHARANLMVKVERSARDDVKKFLTNHHNVNSVYKISDGFDFLIEGIFRNVKDVEDFIDTLAEKFKLEQTKVHYVIEDIMRESFMSDGRLLDINFS